MQMTDSSITAISDEWVEFDSHDASPKERSVRARSANKTLDIEPPKFACRCWRCRDGGVAVGDMGPMDRIVARQLLRMSEQERDDWWFGWAANPSHGPEGERALRAWMAIERGEDVLEPHYTARGRV